MGTSCTASSRARRHSSSSKTSAKVSKVMRTAESIAHGRQAHHQNSRLLSCRQACALWTQAALLHRYSSSRALNFSWSSSKTAWHLALHHTWSISSTCTLTTRHTWQVSLSTAGLPPGNSLKKHVTTLPPFPHLEANRGLVAQPDS